MKMPTLQIATLLALCVTALTSQAQGSFVVTEMPGQLRGTLIIHGQNKGVGWAFVPAMDIRVTELGLGNNGSTFDVTLWTSDFQILSHERITPTFDPWTETYQPITPVMLSAGSRYFIGAEITNSTPTDGWAFASMIFNASSLIAPQLQSFESYFIHTDGTWQSGYTDTFFLGPTFQFEIVPEPSVLTFGMIGFGLALLQRRNNNSQAKSL